jgi:hypothetical protein
MGVKACPKSTKLPNVYNINDTTNGVNAQEHCERRLKVDSHAVRARLTRILWRALKLLIDPVSGARHVHAHFRLEPQRRQLTFGVR